MKKILDCIVLILAALLVYCVFVASVVSGEITIINTGNNNYILYKNGKLVGYAKKFSNGNIKIRDTRGNTKQIRTRASSMRRNNPAVRAPHMTDRQYTEMLRRWRMSRYSAIKAGGMYWWELAYPSIFHK